GLRHASIRAGGRSIQLCAVARGRQSESREAVCARTSHQHRRTVGATRSPMAHPRKIDRPLVERLFQLEFVDKSENILFRGQSGVGKTMLAQCLGLAALQAGYSVRFSTLAAALADLVKQESLPALERRLRHYVYPDILILDEIGYLPCDARAADLLY